MDSKITASLTNACRRLVRRDTARHTVTPTTKRRSSTRGAEDAREETAVVTVLAPNLLQSMRVNAMILTTHSSGRVRAKAPPMTKSGKRGGSTRRIKPRARIPRRTAVKTRLAGPMSEALVDLLMSGGLVDLRLVMVAAVAVNGHRFVTKSRGALLAAGLTSVVTTAMLTRKWET